VPDLRSFMLPISDYRIERNWDVAGLSGSGSNDIVVENAFVPEYRSVSHWDYALGTPLPGREVNPNPMYQLPFGIVFIFTICATMFGAVESFFAKWLELTQKRMGMAGPVAADPFVQKLAAHAMYLIDGAKLRMERDCNELMDVASAGERLPYARRAQIRFNGVNSANLCGKLADDLLQKSSGGVVFNNHPLQQRYRDIKAISGHLVLDPDGVGMKAGASLLGLPVLDPML
jgi:3-hydroxy-9,10-secoandrosta-1,3,5(10)-triene-9,17-dione monooxygenase